MLYLSLSVTGEGLADELANDAEELAYFLRELTAVRDTIDDVAVYLSPQAAKEIAAKLREYAAQIEEGAE